MRLEWAREGGGSEPLSLTAKELASPLASLFSRWWSCLSLPARQPPAVCLRRRREREREGERAESVPSTSRGVGQRGDERWVDTAQTECCFVFWVRRWVAAELVRSDRVYAWWVRFTKREKRGQRVEICRYICIYLCIRWGGAGRRARPTPPSQVCVCLFISVYICLSICLSICPMTIYLSNYRYLYIFKSISISIPMPIYQSTPISLDL